MCTGPPASSGMCTVQQNHQQGRENTMSSSTWKTVYYCYRRMLDGGINKYSSMEWNYNVSNNALLWLRKGTSNGPSTTKECVLVEKAECGCAPGLSFTCQAHVYCSLIIIAFISYKVSVSCIHISGFATCTSCTETASIQLISTNETDYEIDEEEKNNFNC